MESRSLGLVHFVAGTFEFVKLLVSRMLSRHSKVILENNAYVSISWLHVMKWTWPPDGCLKQRLSGRLPDNQEACWQIHRTLSNWNNRTQVGASLRYPICDVRAATAGSEVGADRGFRQQRRALPIQARKWSAGVSKADTLR